MQLDNKERDGIAPVWFWVLMICAGIYLVYASFQAGVKEAELRDRIIQARLEAMKNPPTRSLPEHLLEYDKFLFDNQ